MAASAEDVLSALKRPVTASRAAGIEAILRAWEKYGTGNSRQLAYVLATAWHETAQTFQPIGEYGGAEYKRRLYDVTGDNPTRARKMGNTDPGDGVLYAGRGFVQLTWKVNYAKAGTILDMDLVGDPDLAMDLDVAARILVVGMLQGWFTGKKLSDYITDVETDYLSARRIVNGTDQAEKIAGYAYLLEPALSSDEHPLLKQGAVGPFVSKAQRLLGLSPVDGVFGRNTKSAVIARQKAAGLTADGIVGAATWAELLKESTP